MGNQRVRFDADTLRTTDKTPPFSNDMRHDAAISFETFKFRPEDIHTAAGSENKKTSSGTSSKKTKHPKSSGKRGAAGKRGKPAANGGQGAGKAAEAAKKTVEIAVKAAQKVAAAVARFIAFLAANPIILVILIAVILLIVLLFQAANVLQNTPRNVMGEEMYTDIQAYLREKDRETLNEFEEYENRPEFADVAGENITKEIQVYPATSIKLMAAYLCAKCENGLTLDIARREIDAVHSQLYRIEYSLSTETYEVEEPVFDVRGDPVFNADGSQKTKTVTKEKQVLTITLTGQTLKQYFDDNLDSLLTEQQRANYDWFVFVAGLWGSGDFGPPFEDENYMATVTQEFGVPSWSDPSKPHTGMDFAYPEGTPVLNVIRGKVMEVSYHWSYGLNVVVESEDGTCKVRYAHLSAVSVGVGETIATGETVGLVGSTGVSSGPHLHIEIMVDGQLQNPQDYLPVDQ